MRFTPRERDRMMIAVAAMIAKDRLARGVRLNHPESVALVTNFILEGARDGRTVAELTSSACKVLACDHVMEGVDSMIEEIQVDATFPDGVKLVSVHNPVR